LGGVLSYRDIDFLTPITPMKKKLACRTNAKTATANSSTKTKRKAKREKE
jgi:hypothetical protein